MLVEYLPTSEEAEVWKKAHEDDRERNFLPHKYASAQLSFLSILSHCSITSRYGCLRHVPAYETFLQERFQRCLDLYLCPRAQRVRVRIGDNFDSRR